MVKCTLNFTYTVHKMNALQKTHKMLFNAGFYSNVNLWAKHDSSKAAGSLLIGGIYYEIVGSLPSSDYVTRGQLL